MKPSPRWGDWQPLRRLGIGAGISLEEADQIAHNVSKDAVLSYADEVHQTLLDWLGSCHENDLDQLLDSSPVLAAFPQYQTPGFIEEVKHLFNRPVWDLLIAPCTAHIYRHHGELEIVKDMVRTNQRQL